MVLLDIVCFMYLLVNIATTLQLIVYIIVIINIVIAEVVLCNKLLCSGDVWLIVLQLLWWSQLRMRSKLLEWEMLMWVTVCSLLTLRTLLSEDFV